MRVKAVEYGTLESMAKALRDIALGAEDADVIAYLALGGVLEDDHMVDDVDNLYESIVHEKCEGVTYDYNGTEHRIRAKSPEQTRVERCPECGEAHGRCDPKGVGHYRG